MAESFLSGKRVLVTGGSGTVGRWLVREILAHKPEVVRVFDQDETGLFEFAQELGGFAQDRTRFLVGDVRDELRLRRAMEHIDMVVHCAAYKHVELMEYNPSEAVRTNIMGVQSLINASLDADVDRVLFTSSDKAANPSNMMGATKLVGEKLIVAANFAKGPRRTKLAAVRFGNVLGSRGSIVPLFRRQISEGGPVTITHPGMTRFVLTQADAVQLVVTALRRMVGGEVFIPKMASVRIADLLDVMVKELTAERGPEAKPIQVKRIGLKPGEKLYEELITPEEAGRTYMVDDLFVVLSPIRDVMSKATLAYTKRPRARARNLSSHEARKLTRGQVRELLRGQGLL